MPDHVERIRFYGVRIDIRSVRSLIDEIERILDASARVTLLAEIRPGVLLDYDEVANPTSTSPRTLKSLKIIVAAEGAGRGGDVSIGLGTGPEARFTLLGPVHPNWETHVVIRNADQTVAWSLAETIERHLNRPAEPPWGLLGAELLTAFAIYAGWVSDIEIWQRILATILTIAPAWVAVAVHYRTRISLRPPVWRELFSLDVSEAAVSRWTVVSGWIGSAALVVSVLAWLFPL
ncbi:hypothetical protein ACIRD9_11725 [Streptomyces violaceus]|uniref:hypothetical protein n=1 Tax=Streptomyces violaceus TaxID=1936 RepID=UPI00382EF17B